MTSPREAAGRPLQYIEPLSNPVPPPVQRPAPPTVTPPAPPPVPDVVYAGRFATASGALAFVGVLRATRAAAEITPLRAGENGDWWVTVPIELELGRQLARMASATPYVLVGGALLPDLGYGPPPEPGPPSEAGADDAVELGGLVRTEVLTLLRAAGVRRVPVRPIDQLHLLLGGADTAHVIRRAIDLGLSVRHRPVRLHPLFATGNSNGNEPAEPATMIELVVAAPQDTLPPALVTALTRDPTLVACRAAGGRHELLIEHAVAAPLADHVLAGLVDAGTWVLATSPFGCRRLEPLGDFTDSAGLVRVAEDYPLAEEELAASPLETRLPAVRVVPRRTPYRVLDAVLFDDAELPTARLLLEGDPLAETAQIVRGRDRHLLIAPGGVLERVPAGLPLYAVGPGPLYLPLGYALRPDVPASARRELFGADQDRAVVLTPQGGWAFDLGAAVPVWALWVGELPEVVTQAADGDLRALLDGVRPDPVQPATLPATEPARGRSNTASWWRLRRGGSDETATPGTWHEQALKAELAGRLEEAAGLHRRNGSLLRAARLYERAALQAEGR
ncbi:hypothetical protein [Paractinoplanes globisporus]|uniref:FtsH ternary system domain-containing protein n=1 Tax=Paractinoplanes globisporus TaxID=113565 RepID=A0ABW6WBU6_9ACTN|nr:hypothetical protein [Actinoplanes globisporus]